MGRRRVVVRAGLPRTRSLARTKEAVRESRLLSRSTTGPSPSPTHALCVVTDWKGNDDLERSAGAEFVRLRRNLARADTRACGERTRPAPDGARGRNRTAGRNRQQDWRKRMGINGRKIALRRDRRPRFEHAGRRAPRGTAFGTYVGNDHRKAPRFDHGVWG